MIADSSSPTVAHTSSPMLGACNCNGTRTPVAGGAPFLGARGKEQRPGTRNGVGEGERNPARRGWHRRPRWPGMVSGTPLDAFLGGAPPRVGKWINLGDTVANGLTPPICHAESCAREQSLHLGSFH